MYYYQQNFLSHNEQLEDKTHIMAFFDIYLQEYQVCQLTQPKQSSYPTSENYSGTIPLAD